MSILRILWWIAYGLFIILMWVAALAALLLLVTMIAVTFGGVGWPE
jgi:hypothetical protein